MKQSSKKTIRKKISQKTNKYKSWKEYFRSDKAILTICISIAFVFWLVIKLSYIYRTTIVLPITYAIKEGLTFTVPPPTQCVVDVRATGWNLMNMQKSQLLISEERLHGNSIIASQELQQEVQKIFGTHIQIYSIAPELITVNIDSLLEKQVPIMPNVHVKTLPQYRLLGAPKVIPSNIVVEGPKSIVDSIQNWETEFIEFDSVNISMRKIVPLKIHENLQVHTNIREAELQIEVQQLTEKKIVLPIASNKKLQLDSFIVALIPNQVTLTCLVGLQDYGKLSPSDFELEVDMPDLSKMNTADKMTQINTLKVKIKKKPMYAEVSSIEPQSVQYLIRKID